MRELVPGSGLGLGLGLGSALGSALGLGLGLGAPGERRERVDVPGRSLAHRVREVAPAVLVDLVRVKVRVRALTLALALPYP